MRWDESHESSDVEDRRGEGPTGGGGRPSIAGALVPLAFSRFGIVGGLVVMGLLAGVSFLFSDAPSSPSGPAGSSRAPAGAHGGTAPAEKDKEARFAGFVLDDTQQVWAAIFAKNGQRYTRTKLVLYSGTTHTACGLGESATGPFYCPGDQKVYLDLQFFQTLANRLKAKGDFAQAYVIAHEIGHHIQHQLGGDRQSHARGANAGSVRAELQADCYAGIWARSTQQRHLVEVGDLDEVMAATAAMGDDTLQRKSTGTVRPETFSHGTSAQRKHWFQQGFDRGTLQACDTLAAPTL